MTTLLERHAAKLEAAESAEVAVYKVALKWAPSQRAANEERATLERAQREVQTAQAECNRLLAEISERNLELGTELVRLHNAGKLCREAIGEGGDRRVKDVLTAETNLGKARKQVTDASKSCHDANTGANVLFRDALLALDALKPLIPAEEYQAISRVFSDARKDPDRVADQCRTRLSVLGVKA